MFTHTKRKLCLFGTSKKEKISAVYFLSPPSRWLGGAEAGEGAVSDYSYYKISLAAITSHICLLLYIHFVAIIPVCVCECLSFVLSIGGGGGPFNARRVCCVAQMRDRED